MKKIFITYGDSKFENALKKILLLAERTHQFDEIIGFKPNDLSEALLNHPIMKEKRGGGLWSWKIDIIFNTINHSQEGDIIVYADSGCTLYSGKEWEKYWKLLETSDLLGFRINQRSNKWTRSEILEYFSNTNQKWKNSYQFAATVIILKVSDFTKNLFSELRNLILTSPLLLYDVNKTDLLHQHKDFIENRHDQSVFSALLYDYIYSGKAGDHIKILWEHYEGYDLLKRQVIRATRLRAGERESLKKKIRAIFSRIYSDLIYRPLIIR